MNCYINPQSIAQHMCEWAVFLNKMLDSWCLWYDHRYDVIHIVGWFSFLFPDCESDFCESSHKCFVAGLNAQLYFGLNAELVESGKIYPGLLQQYHVPSLNLILCVKLSCDYSSFNISVLSSLLFGFLNFSCFEVLRSSFLSSKIIALMVFYYVLGRYYVLMYLIVLVEYCISSAFSTMSYFYWFDLAINRYVIHSINSWYLFIFLFSSWNYRYYLQNAPVRHFPRALLKCLYFISDVFSSIEEYCCTSDSQ